jgi:hypothetical protein
MNSRLVFRFAATGLALAFATASSPTPPQPKPVLLDCQVIPIQCTPDDVCGAVAHQIPSFDEYHFALSENDSTTTYTLTTGATTTITKTTPPKEETAKSENGKTSSSSTSPTETTSREVTWTMTQPTPTPIPPTNPLAVATKTMTRSKSSTTNMLNPADVVTIAMLDTPHDYPDIFFTPRPLTTTALNLDGSLNWQFPDSVYKQTRFVLWRDTLRLDVTTQRYRYVYKDEARRLKLVSKSDWSGQFGQFFYNLYHVTLLWSGTCSQAPTQLP